jgi:hypothetical protein
MAAQESSEDGTLFTNEELEHRIDDIKRRKEELR